MKAYLLSFIPFYKETDESTPPFKSVSGFSEGLEPIKQLICFIGSNHLGKSRLIRQREDKISKSL